MVWWGLQFNFQHSHQMAHIHVTIAPRHPTPFPGLRGHCIHMYNTTLSIQTHNFSKKIFFNFLEASRQPPAWTEELLFARPHTTYFTCILISVLTSNPSAENYPLFPLPDVETNCNSHVISQTVHTIDRSDRTRVHTAWSHLFTQWQLQEVCCQCTDPVRSPATAGGTTSEDWHLISSVDFGMKTEHSTCSSWSWKWYTITRRQAPASVI